MNWFVECGNIHQSWLLLSLSVITKLLCSLNTFTAAATATARKKVAHDITGSGCAECALVDSHTVFLCIILYYILIYYKIYNHIIITQRSIKAEVLHFIPSKYRKQVSKIILFSQARLLWGYTDLCSNFYFLPFVLKFYKEYWLISGTSYFITFVLILIEQLSYKIIQPFIYLYIWLKFCIVIVFFRKNP